MNDVFIYTEVVNCGKIGKIALKTFFRHHPKIKVHVYGSKKDFNWIKEFKNSIVWHDVDKEFSYYLEYSKKLPFLKIQKFSNYFLQGHWGTAQLWARLILSRPEKYFIHFDSDVIFQKESVSDITKAFDDGYDLVGPIRNYKNNANNREDVRHLSDITQTVFFGFNTQKISTKKLSLLVKMCRGSYNPLGHPVIDFFDPVSFEILNNGGKIKLLSAIEYGGRDKTGKVSTHSKLNRYLGYGTKLVHFSGVGSGLNFIENKDKLKFVPKSYQDFALKRYALYLKLFYNEECGVQYDQEAYKSLKSELYYE